MNRTALGEISQINRYPIKSFAGESLSRVSIRSYGLMGDRSYAFVEPTKDGWSRYITARQIPELLRYKAELIETTESQFPQVKITGPDGRIFKWNEQLHNEIQSLSNDVLSTEQFSLESQEQHAVDAASILIITDRSLKRMEQLWGKPLDPRRFRANLLLELNDDAVYEDEADFVGKQFMIGDVQLSIRKLCKRCSMITIDPDHLERDSSLLTSIQEHMNINFGLYADVVSKGTVNVGDKVYMNS